MSAQAPPGEQSARMSGQGERGPDVDVRHICYLNTAYETCVVHSSHEDRIRDGDRRFAFLIGFKVLTVAGERRCTPGMEGICLLLCTVWSSQMCARRRNYV